MDERLPHGIYINYKEAELANSYHPHTLKLYCRDSQTNVESYSANLLHESSVWKIPFISVPTLDIVRLLSVAI